MLTGSCLCGEIAFEVNGTVDDDGALPLLDVPEVSRRRLRHPRHGTAGARFRWVRGRGANQYIPLFGTRATGDSAPVAAPPCPDKRKRACHSHWCPWATSDEDPGTRPSLHWFTGSMAPWHTIVDDLPQHEGVSAQNSGRTPGCRWTVPSRAPANAGRHRRKLPLRRRSHSSSTTRRYGCTTATARAAGAP